MLTAICMGAKHLLLLSLLALVFFLSFLIAVTYTQLHCQSMEYQRSCMELSGFHISEPTDGCSRVSGTRRRVLHPKKTEPTLDFLALIRYSRCSLRLFPPSHPPLTPLRNSITYHIPGLRSRDRFRLSQMRFTSVGSRKKATLALPT